MVADNKPFIWWLVATVMALTLSLVLTYPLCIRSADSLVNLRDPLLNTYLLGHGVRTLFSKPLEYFQLNIFYPFSDTRAFSEHYLFQTLAAAPIVLWSGNPALGHNVMIILAFFVSGLGMFFLASELTGSRYAALTAAAIFMSLRMRAAYIANLQIQWIGFLPFALGFFHRYMKRGRMRDLSLFTVFLALQVLASVYYAAFSYLLIGCLALMMAIAGYPGLNLRRVIAVLTAGVLVFAVTLPVHFPYLLTNLRYQASTSLAAAETTAADFDQYFKLPLSLDDVRLSLPAELLMSIDVPFFPGVLASALVIAAVLMIRRVLGSVVVRRLSFLTVKFVFLGALALIFLGLAANYVAGPFEQAVSAIAGLVHPFILLPLAIFPIVYFAAAKFRAAEGEGREVQPLRNIIVYGSTAIVFAVISFGPFVHVERVQMGWGIYAPLYFLLPPLQAIRFVRRFAVMVLICLTVVAAIGAAVFMARINRKKYAPAVATLFLVLFTTFETGFKSLTLEAVPAEEPKVYRWLAEQPGSFAVLELPVSEHVEQQTIRQYWSLSHGKKLASGYSGWRPPLDYAVYAYSRAMPDPEAFKWLRRLPVRYFIVHDDGQNTVERMTVALGDQRRFLSPAARCPDAVVFKNAEDSLEGQSEIRYFPVSLLEGASLSFRAKVRKSDDNPGRTVLRILLDDLLVAELELSRRWRQFDVRLPALSGIADVRSLGFSFKYKPRRIPRSEIPGLTDAFPADVQIKCAARETGLLSQLYTSLAIFGERRTGLGKGYNLLAIDRSGAVVKTAAFDTDADSAASHRIAAFVDSLPPGTFVIGATCYRAAGCLAGEGLEALHRLGARGCDDVALGRARNHAFIGLVGASPGTALEKWGDEDIELSVGRSQDRLGFRITGLRIIGPDENIRYPCDAESSW